VTTCWARSTSSASTAAARGVSLTSLPPRHSSPAWRIRRKAPKEIGGSGAVTALELLELSRKSPITSLLQFPKEGACAPHRPQLRVPAPREGTDGCIRNPVLGPGSCPFLFAQTLPVDGAYDLVFQPVADVIYAAKFVSDRQSKFARE
jgi:hypothetical protein